MKWIGQHIVDLIARFRGDVYLEDLSTTTSTDSLVVDSDGKISKNTSIGGDITSLGTLSRLAVTSAEDLGSAAIILTNQDVDQKALEISASNITANIIDIDATTITSGNAIFIDSVNAESEIYVDKDITQTTNLATRGLIQLACDKAVNTASGQNTLMVGLQSIISDTGTNVGTSNIVNLDIHSNMTNADGTTKLYGISNTITGASDDTIGFYSNVRDGNPDIKLVSSADGGDFCTIDTTTHGATTITTTDDDATAAHFEIAADGDIILDAAGQIKLEPVAGNNILLDGVLTVDAGVVIPTVTAHDTEGTAISIGAGATTAGTTNNIAGGRLTIHGGQGKGSGAGGDIVFQTANASGSGSSLNALATALTISDDLSATFAGAIVGNVTGNASGTAATVTAGTQAAITSCANLVTVGTIGTGVWQGTAIATNYLKHKSSFELAGYAVADGTNYMMADIMSGNKAPFLHDETSIGAAGTTADNPAAFLRAAGTVMPYAGTLKIWKGWGASNGTPTVDVAIFKYTPTADDATSDSLVLVINTQFTGAGNDNLKAWSETSFSVTVAAGDILITAIKGSTNNKTAYFTSTVEIEWS